MLLTTFSSGAGVHRVFLDRSACTESVDKVLDLKVRYVHSISLRVVRMVSHGSGPTVAFDMIFYRGPGNAAWEHRGSKGDSHMPPEDKQWCVSWFMKNSRALTRWVAAMPEWQGVEGD